MLSTRYVRALAGGVLGTVLLLGAAGAEQPETAESLANAATTYQGRIREAKLQYLTDLKAVLKTSMSKGDFEKAKRIDAVRSQIETELNQDSWRDVPNVPDAMRAPAPANPDDVDPDSRVLESGSFLAKHVLGDWVLENDSGGAISPMRIEGLAYGQVELIRIGGGPLAVCGTYVLQGRKLVKLKRPGDPYWDLTWRASGGKWALREGQYSGWTLKRPDNAAAKRTP